MLIIKPVSEPSQVFWVGLCEAVKMPFANTVTVSVAVAEEVTGEEKGKKVEAEASPFQFPTDEDINECAIPKIKKYINGLADLLYQEKIFPTAPTFKNTMFKEEKNPRTILHTLIRCYLKKQFNKEGPWAYCERIMQIEEGNFNEREFQKTAISDND